MADRTVTYLGSKWIVRDDGAVHIIFDDGTDEQARTHCPGCDGYGFHRTPCPFLDAVERGEL